MPRKKGGNAAALAKKVGMEILKTAKGKKVLSDALKKSGLESAGNAASALGFGKKKGGRKKRGGARRKRGGNAVMNSILPVYALAKSTGIVNKGLDAFGMPNAAKVARAVGLGKRRLGGRKRGNGFLGDLLKAPLTGVAGGIMGANQGFFGSLPV